MESYILLYYLKNNGFLVHTIFQISMYLNGIIAFDTVCNPLCNHPPSYGDASDLWDNGIGGDWDDNLSPSIAVFWTNMIDETCCNSNTNHCITSGGELEGSFVLFMKNLPFYNPVTDICDYDNLLTYEVMLLNALYMCVCACSQLVTLTSADI